MLLWGAIILLAVAAGWILVYRKRLQCVRTILGTMSSEVVVVDASGKILFCQPGTTGEIRPVRTFDELPEEIRNVFREPIRQVLGDGKTLRVEYAGRGGQRSAEITRLPRSLFGTDSVMWASSDIDSIHYAAERFRQTLKSISEGVIAVDTDERIILVNRIACRLSGYSRDELIGKSFADFACMVKLTGKTSVRTVLEEKRTIELSASARMTAPDGHCCRLAGSMSPILNENERLLGAVVVFRDVTEEHEKMDQLELQNYFLKTAADTMKITFFSRDRRNSQNYFDSEKENHYWGRHDDGTPYTAEEWVAPEKLAEFHEAWEKLNSGKEQSISITYAGGPSDVKNSFFEMQVTKRKLADGSEDCFGLIRDITDETRAICQKNDMELLFQTLLENLPCGAYVKEIDNEFRLLMCNKYLENLLGQSRNEFLGKTDYEFLPEDVAELQKKHDQEAVQTGKLTDHIATFSTKNGESRVGHFYRSVINRSDGHPLLLCVCVDVTEEIHKNQEINEVNFLLNQVIQNLPCFFWMKDCGDDFRYVLANNFYHQMMGLPGQKIVGKTDYDFHPSELAAKYRNDDRAVVKADRREEFYEEIQTPSGIRHLRTLKIPLLDYKKRKLLLGMSFDISELMANRDELQETNLMFQAIQDNLPCAFFVKDADDDYRYLMCNRHYASFLGVTCDQVVGAQDPDLYSDPKEIASCARSDRMAVENGYNDANEVLIRNGVSYTLRCIKSRLIQKNGHRLVLGICVDISEEKRLLAELHRLMEELKAHAEQEHLLNRCLEYVLLNEDEASAIQLVLKMVGERLSADHAYCFRYDYEENRILPNQEWCRNGQPQRLEYFPRFTITPKDEWFRLFENRKMLELPDVTDPEARRVHGCWANLMPKFQVHSLYAIGIWRNHELWGHIGLSYTNQKTDLNEQEKNLLQSCAHIVEMILERQKNRAELERSEYERLLIMDTIQIPILLFDADMNLIRCNNAALGIAGISEEEVYLRPCRETFCKSIAPSDCPVRQAAGDLCEHTAEATILGREYLMRAYPIIIDGKLVYIMKTLIDVTDLNETQKKLKLALKNAQDASKAKSYFLATMSHELRTPLNAVIGFSELLESGELSKEEHDEYLRSINLAGNSLLSLINDVLDLSKLEAEQMVLVPKSTDIPQLLRELQSVFLYKIQQKKLSFRVECPEGLPNLRLDTLRLRQILLNLIGNAVKFTDQGEVALSVSYEPTDEQKGTLLISVHDSGIGISPEAQKRIFEPFIQSDTVRDSHVYQGTGLGLAISQRLAIRMGGQIRLQSELGKGSTFQLELHGVELANAPVAKLNEAPAVAMKKLRILLVDDVKMNLMVLSAMLRRFGVESLMATSGDEALRILKEKKPDMVLTDLWMPGMNGAELVEQARRQPGMSKFVAIAVTADAENRNNFDMTLFDGILLKPITWEQLSRTLARFYGIAPKTDLPKAVVSE